MKALEWAFFGKDYVHNIIAIATSSYQSAWGISWNEAQRQAIFCDPNYSKFIFFFYSLIKIKIIIIIIIIINNNNIINYNN